MASKGSSERSSSASSGNKKGTESNRSSTTSIKATEKDSNLPVELRDPHAVTLLTHPLITLKYLVIIVYEFVKQVFGILLRWWPLVLLPLLALLAAYQLDGEHRKYLRHGEQIAYFVVYWVILGVASSIGLGTGLHTFVLYLGPWIAKVTMVANDCKAIPNMIPNKWAFEMFDQCPAHVAQPITFWEILHSVQLEAFLWGLGTAIGELPPYFMARAAARSRQKADELREIEEEVKHGDKTLLTRIKALIYNNLQRYGFVTVLLCASIPNPLFDLAGITCGHFGIPFATFFTATAIGKAVIKVHLQTVFVIFAFSAHHVEHALSYIEKLIPSLRGTLSTLLDKQRASLHSPQQHDGPKPIIQFLWDYFITLMIAYFAFSIVNSLVQSHLAQLKEDREAKQKKKK